MPAATQEARELYEGGEYAARHSDWHLADAPDKARDLMPGLRAVVKDLGGGRLRIADVGAGVGGVLVELTRLAREEFAGIELDATAFEFAPEPVKMAREKFPDLRIHQRLLQADDGPFDVVVLADVLEHLENPWELLRLVGRVSKYLLVRQPLLESLGCFRSNGYANQRETWGHIGFFNVRSFRDMLAATGWAPLKTDLVAWWELSGKQPCRNPLKRMLVRWNRELASILISGFYFNGALKRA